VLISAHDNIGRDKKCLKTWLSETQVQNGIHRFTRFFCRGNEPWKFRHFLYFLAYHRLCYNYVFIHTGSRKPVSFFITRSKRSKAAERFQPFLHLSNRPCGVQSKHLHRACANNGDFMLLARWLARLCAWLMSASWQNSLQRSKAKLSYGLRRLKSLTTVGVFFSSNRTSSHRRDLNHLSRSC
jgi:hypothetical protein